ncbi:MAG TPA: thioredoxin family protein [Gaiellaceae bacterium]|nr:thioredoxin family protein [Gaiellaceae bacterium]
MLDLDSATFDSAIAGDPVVVDFWAPWCRPCKAIEPILERLEAQVPVARLNIDEHPEIGARYEVLTVPTVMLFAGGEARGVVRGARPFGHFERWLAEVLPAGERERLAVQGQADA